MKALALKCSCQTTPINSWGLIFDWRLWLDRQIFASAQSIHYGFITMFTFTVKRQTQFGLPLTLYLYYLYQILKGKVCNKVGVHRTCIQQKPILTWLQISTVYLLVNLKSQSDCTYMYQLSTNLGILWYFFLLNR